MKDQPKIYSQVNFRLILTTLCILLVCPACDLFCPECLECPKCAPDNPGISKPADSFIINSQGGIFQAINGNVTLYVPESALDEEVNLVVKEGPIDYEGDFVVRSIEINPKSVFFKLPVELSLKYNGQLNCGKDPCNAKCLAIYHFKNDKDFDVRNQADMLWISKCCVNRMDCCIETKIQSGGIFAIGEESLGQPAIYQP